MITAKDKYHFKQEFWKWFDLLSKKEKAVFWYYPGDFAEIFYFNKVYRHIYDIEKV